MSIGNLCSTGKNESTTAVNIYHVTISMIVDNMSSSICFYSSKQISSFSDLINYVKSNGYHISSSNYLPVFGSIGTGVQNTIGVPIIFYCDNYTNVIYLNYIQQNLSSGTASTHYVGIDSTTQLNFYVGVV